MTDRENQVAKKATPVVDPALAPATPDAMMPQTPTKDEFLDQARKIAAQQQWQAMVSTEQSVRTMKTNGQAEVMTPQGVAIAVETNPKVLARQLAAREAEAVRQRKVASKLVQAHDVDELDLLAARIGQLRQFIDANQQDLWVHELYVDHPDQVGFTMLDGYTPINTELSLRSIEVLKVAIADAQSELAYYTGV